MFGLAQQTASPTRQFGGLLKVPCLSRFGNTLVILGSRFDFDCYSEDELWLLNLKREARIP